MEKNLIRLWQSEVSPLSSVAVNNDKCPPVMGGGYDNKMGEYI